ncbi:hypothetical protein D3C78_1862190 [compost metagenome]
MMEEIKFKTFPVRMSLQMNTDLRNKAFKENTTVHQLVLKAIYKELTGADEAV